VVLAPLPLRRCLARGEASSLSVDDVPIYHRNRQNLTIWFVKLYSPISAASNRSFQLLFLWCGKHKEGGMSVLGLVYGPIGPWVGLLSDFCWIRGEADSEARHEDYTENRNFLQLSSSSRCFPCSCSNP
jgi:hypothetical protein